MATDLLDNTTLGDGSRIPRLLGQFKNQVLDRYKSLADTLRSDPVAKEFQRRAKLLEDTLRDYFANNLNSLVADISRIKLPTFDEEFDSIRKSIDQNLTDTVRGAVLGGIDKFIADNRAAVEKWFGTIDPAGLNAVAGKAKQAIDLTQKVLDQLKTAQLWRSPDVQRALTGLMTTAASSVGRALEPFARPAEQMLRTLESETLASLPNINNLADRTMRLARAFGAPPIGQALEFAHDRLAYFFHEVEQGSQQVNKVLDAVHFTETLAFLNQGSARQPASAIVTALRACRIR